MSFFDREGNWTRISAATTKKGLHGKIKRWGVGKSGLKNSKLKEIELLEKTMQRCQECDNNDVEWIIF